MKKLNVKSILITMLVLATGLGLFVAAYATDLFGLGKEKAISSPGEETDRLSLQNISESSEYRACKDWTDFIEKYDLEGTILSQAGDSYVWDKDYEEIYGCYSQEMVDKVDEICVKYQLARLSEFQFIKDYEDFLSKAGIGDVKKSSWNNGQNNIIGGFFYADGSFHLEGSAVMTKPRSCIMDYQFMRAVKGSFSPTALNVGNWKDYREWEYTTQSGEQVLLENSSRKALIIAEREKSFVVVNVLGDVEGNLFDVTDQTLEELAEMFDFSVIP